MRIKIISPGKHREPWLIAALAEYEKRLSHTIRLEWVFPKELKPLTEPYCLLDVKGKSLTSESFSSYLQSAPHHTFVIGGAEGPPKEILESATTRISLSPLTLTHQMVRLLLIEQIYRGLEIAKGSAYHK